MIERELEERMLRVCQNLIDMLELAFQAFRSFKEDSFKESEEMREEFRRYSSELTSYLISKGGSMEKGGWGIKPFLSIASSFDRMAYNIDGLFDRLKMKAQQHILFSDHAVKEINDVFQEAMELLENLPKLISSKDKALARHIGEMGRSIFKIANGYSEEHESRLLQGICLPKSSPIYLGILESLKGVILHTLEVSGKIASLSHNS